MTRSSHQLRLSARLDELESLCRILCLDQITARHYASIRRELKLVGTPIRENDLWIAACVRQHAVPLVSRDPHFDRVAGVQRIGW